MCSPSSGIKKKKPEMIGYVTVIKNLTMIWKTSKKIVTHFHYLVKKKRLKFWNQVEQLKQIFCQPSYSYLETSQIQEIKYWRPNVSIDLDSINCVHII